MGREGGWRKLKEERRGRGGGSEVGEEGAWGKIKGGEGTERRCVGTCAGEGRKGRERSTCTYLSGEIMCERWHNVTNYVVFYYFFTLQFLPPPPHPPTPPLPSLLFLPLLLFLFLFLPLLLLLLLLFTAPCLPRMVMCLPCMTCSMACCPQTWRSRPTARSPTPPSSCPS